MKHLPHTNWLLLSYSVPSNSSLLVLHSFGAMRSPTCLILNNVMRWERFKVRFKATAFSYINWGVWIRFKVCKLYLEVDSSFKIKFNLKPQHIKQTCSHGPMGEGSESHILLSCLQKALELPTCSTEHSVKLNMLDDYFIKYPPVLKFNKSKLSSIIYFYYEN